MKDVNLDSRVYKLNEIGKEDKRFVVCKKEGLFIQILSFVVTFLGVFLAYWLSPTKAEIESGVKLMTIGGYPVWLMVPAAIYLFQACLMIFLALKVFKRPSLEARVVDKEIEL